MSIQLNLTTAAQPLRSKPLVRPAVAKVTRKKANAAPPEGFSFEFGGGRPKVKAFVARKRVVTKVNAPSQINKNVAKPSDMIPTAKEATGKPQHASVQQARQEDVGTVAVNQKSKVLGSSFSQSASNEKQQPTAALESSDLTLNICTVSAPANQPLQKAALSRAERLQKKRLQQKGTNQIDGRTLTQQEVKDSIHKLATQPFKRGNQHKSADTPQQKTGDDDQPLEFGKVNPKARKANAFRVRRPEDSSVKKINLFKNNPAAQVMGQRFVKPITERIFDGTKVSTLPLHAHAIKNLADLLSITELTTVQQKVIPQALEGKDMLVRSQTGSGKTLAYALPVVEQLQAIRPKITRDDGVLVVVIVPTRELAIQTYELFQKLVKPFTWIVPGALMGGERRKAEKARLRKGINILVGTPGRLVDHLLHTESFKLSKTKYLVLDEADRMLEMGYERDVKQIVEAIDKHREQLGIESNTPVGHLQRFLLSATLTQAVQKLAGLTLKEPLFIDNSDEDPAKAIRNANGYTKEAIEVLSTAMQDVEDDGVMTIPENMKLSYVVMPPKLRLVTLSGLLAHEHKAKQQFKVIMFMSTMEMVNFHHDLLNEALTQKVLDEDDENEEKGHSNSEDGDEPLLKGLRFFKLHGSMTQTERQGVFKGFRDCKSGVLLATDVVGRGIDVPQVDLVVQYSPPQTVSDFVHRVGRTARAGRSGRAVLFLAPSEAQFVRVLEDKRIRISQVDMEVYLQKLHDEDDEANTIQEAASNLQHKFEQLILDDKELYKKACKAFVSWMKFYSTFPKELKSVFNIKNTHMGHFAKSFGLRDPPTTFIKKHTEPKPAPPTNRLTYTERDPQKIKQEKRAKKRRFATTVTGDVRNQNRPSTVNRLVKMMPTSRALTTSEFDSGLPALKKRKVGK